jgi:hypothetical protein
VAILAWVDALGATLVLTVGLALGAAPPGSAWSLLPLAAVLTLLVQAALRTYGPDGARRDYARAFAGGLVAVALLLPLAAPTGLLRPEVGPALLMGLALGGIACLGRRLAERGVRWAYERGFGARPTLVVGDAPELEKIGAHMRAGSSHAGTRRPRTRSPTSRGWPR